MIPTLHSTIGQGSIVMFRVGLPEARFLAQFIDPARLWQQTRQCPAPRGVAVDGAGAVRLKFLNWRPSMQSCSSARRQKQPLALLCVHDTVLCANLG